jgi:hypothetical protein
LCTPPPSTAPSEDPASTLENYSHSYEDGSNEAKSKQHDACTCGKNQADRDQMELHIFSSITCSPTLS